MEIISRKEAIQKGLKFYYTGKPCCRGHLSARRISDKSCHECKEENRVKPENKERDRLTRKARYQRKKEIELAQTKAYKEKNKEWYNNYHKKYEKDNAERIYNRKATYYKNNKEYILSRTKEYQRKNRAAYNAASKERTLLKNNRVPKWFNKEKVIEIYKECKRLKTETGIFYVVDHIVPLKGKNVSGLHTHENLRIVEYSINASKLHKWNPDDPYIFSYHEEQQLNDTTN